MCRNGRCSCSIASLSSGKTAAHSGSHGTASAVISVYTAYAEFTANEGGSVRTTALPMPLTLGYLPHPMLNEAASSSARPFHTEIMNPSSSMTCLPMSVRLRPFSNIVVRRSNDADVIGGLLKAALRLFPPALQVANSSLAVASAAKHA